MADAVTIPVIKLVEGFQFEQNWLFQSADGPVDLTTWTGEFSLGYDVNGEKLATITPTLGADGTISVTVPAAAFADITPSNITGGGPVGIYQITLSAPDPVFDQLWQGVFTLAGQM